MLVFVTSIPECFFFCFILFSQLKNSINNQLINFKQS